MANNKIPLEETNIVLLLQRINSNIERMLRILGQVKRNTDRYE